MSHIKLKGGKCNVCFPLFCFFSKCLAIICKLEKRYVILHGI